MKNIIILKQVDVPNCPRFKKDQKVRVKDEIADALVSRDFAKYDPDKKSKSKSEERREAIQKKGKSE